VTSTIKQLHDRKLAIDYFATDLMVKLFDLINTTVTAGGFTLLQKQVSELFQIETSCIRQNNDVAVILQVHCTYVQDSLTIYRHISFPSTNPKFSSNQDMTIWQYILNKSFWNRLLWNF
jgi:hypothetical protein